MVKLSISLLALVDSVEVASSAFWVAIPAWVVAISALSEAIVAFSGKYLISPMVQKEFANLTTGKVILRKYTQLGYNTVVFPGCVLNEGVATGAMSLIKNDIPAWKIVAGIPAKIIKDRKKDLLELFKNI